MMVVMVVVLVIEMVFTTFIYNYVLRIQGTRSFVRGDHFSSNKYR